MRFTKILSAFVLAFLGLILCVSAQAQRTATATPTVANGFIIAATVTDGGAGYTTPPTVTISGGGGSGAIAIATVLNGAVDKVIVQNAGSGYSGTPSVVIAAPPSPKPPFSAGLIAYYPFNGNANDESGKGNNGIVNGATFIADRFGTQGKAMAFNGINQSVQAPHQAYLNFPDGEFTVSFWAALNDLSRLQYFLGKDMGQGIQNKWIAVYDSGFTQGTIFGIGIVINGPGYAFANVKPELGTWHHFLFRKSATHYSIHFDGVAVSSGEGPISLRSDNTAPLTIGQCEGGGYVNGMIDEVRFYNRALPDQEVEDLYAYEAPEQPWLSINVETVRVTMHVKPTKKYQLEASLDLKTWIKAGDVFTVTTSEVTQLFNAIEVGRYFRLSEVP